MQTYQVKPLSKPISAIGLGTMVFHPNTQSRDFTLLDTFVKHGGTLIDTAEVYGAIEQQGFSEMVIGDWLAARPGLRENIVLASKGLIPGYCAELHPGGARIDPVSIHRAIDGSLKRLKTDYLDLWMFHRDDPTYPVGPLVDALDQEVRDGRIRAYGASNWTTQRIQLALDYAHRHEQAPMIGSSPNFCLAKANQPYWPNTIVTDEDDLRWFQANHFMLVAWSPLGRGFFAKGDPHDHSDADLVRVFYSDANFERKQRAFALAQARSVSMIEIALAYVISQDFPSAALIGSASADHVALSTRAGNLRLSKTERDWLDLSSDVRPW